MSYAATPLCESKSAFAARIGQSPSAVTQLIAAGRIVLSPNGKLVDVAASLARMQATADPSKQGVADRHAATRAAKSAAAAPQADSDADQEDDYPPAAAYQPAQQAAQTNPAGNSYQQARAVKERFLALEAKRAYEVAMRELRDAKEVEHLAATAMTELRLRLDNLAASLAPTLAAMTTEDAVRTELTHQFEHTLTSTAHHFATLSAQAPQA